MKFAEEKIRKFIETTDRLSNKNAELWVANVFESFDILPSLQYMILCVPLSVGHCRGIKCKAAPND